MLDIQVDQNGDIQLGGRLDAGEVDKAAEVLSTVRSSCRVDFRELDYISSAGLGLLLATQRRLSGSGAELRLVGMSPHVRLVFEYAGFDSIFRIE